MVGKGLKIAYLTPHIRCDPNRTQFQRPKHLSSKNRLFVFTGRETVLPEEIEKRLRIFRGPLKFGRFSARPLFPVWCIFKVLTLHKEIQFDLIYSTYDCYTSVSAAILKLLGFKWVADLWDHPELWKETKEEGIKKTLLVHIPRLVAFQIVKRALKHADLVISVVHPSALAKFRINPQRILKVTNGVDLSITKPKGLNPSTAEFRVFYVGFLMRERGLNLMLHAVAMLNEKIKGLKLILVGDARSEDVTFLGRVIKKLELEKHVDFRGRLDHEDVLILMERSDVCLFPFPKTHIINSGIYPVKVFEYMAMGKAIVATRLEGISDIVIDEVNGLLVEPSDAREMADAIFEIYRNPALRKRLESNAKKTAKEYDWKAINEDINEKLADFFD